MSTSTRKKNTCLPSKAFVRTNPTKTFPTRRVLNHGLWSSTAQKPVVQQLQPLPWDDSAATPAITPLCMTPPPPRKPPAKYIRRTITSDWRFFFFERDIFSPFFFLLVADGCTTCFSCDIYQYTCTALESSFLFFCLFFLGVDLLRVCQGFESWY